MPNETLSDKIENPSKEEAFPNAENDYSWLYAEDVKQHIQNAQKRLIEFVEEKDNLFREDLANEVNLIFKEEFGSKLVGVKE